MSSPVFAMIVTASAGITPCRPSRNFAAPMPPASAVTFMSSLNRRQSHHAVASRLDLVTSVDADGEHRHALDGASAVERARVNGPQAFDEGDGFDDARAGFFCIARHEDIAIELLVGFDEQVGRLGLEG